MDQGVEVFAFRNQVLFVPDAHGHQTKSSAVERNLA
jgi:hypothetical protein